MRAPSLPSASQLADAARRHRAAVLVAALAVAVALAFAVRACGGGAEERPPAARAARLVPADVLLYLHLSTDGSRLAVERALGLAERFPSFPRARDAALQRLSRARPGLSFERDVRPWLGEEAALALLDTPGATAGSLIVLDVTDRGRAEAFLRRAAGPPRPANYRGTPILAYGNASAAFVEGDMVIGQLPGLRAAIDAAAGRAPSLAGSPTFRRTAGDLPDGRVADAYASPDGVTRLLAPQGGPLGAAGALISQPGLQGVAFALTPEEGGARLTVRSALDRQAARGPQRPRAFSPELIDSVPEGAMAYFGLTRLDRAVGRLVAAGVAGGGAGRQVTALLQRLRADLGRRAGVDLRREVLPLFQGEVALWLAPAIPAPVLTLIASTDDEDATREAFARLQPSLGRLLAPRGGPVPSFREVDVDGTPAFQLRLGPGIELDYAVFDGKLVLSTSLSGVRAVKRRDGSLADDGSFDATLGDRPDRVTSLVFLDFRQLLRLGERTGLNDSRAYLAIRPDLEKVEAVGAAASRGDTESTTELSIQIP